MESRTMRTRKGIEIYTELTDREALELTAREPVQFLIDMHQRVARGLGLSHDQIAWVHKHAMDRRSRLAEGATERAAEGAGSHVFTGLFDHLAAARDRGLKTPGMLLLWPAPAGDRVRVIRVKLMGERSRHVGRVMVCDGPGSGDRLYGYIDPGGAFRPRGATPEPVLMALTLVNDDPEGEARKYGKATGNCCYCEKALDTAESLAAGYGPVCARQRGLPWGNNRVARELAVAAVAALAADFAPAEAARDAAVGALEAERAADRAFAAAEHAAERRGFDSDPDYQRSLARDEAVAAGLLEGPSYRDFPGDGRDFETEADRDLEAEQQFEEELAALRRCGGYY